MSNKITSASPKLPAGQWKLTSPVDCAFTGGKKQSTNYDRRNKEIKQS